MPKKSTTTTTTTPIQEVKETNAIATATPIQEVNVPKVKGSKAVKENKRVIEAEAVKADEHSPDHDEDHKKPKEQQHMKPKPELLTFLEQMKNKNWLDNPNFPKTKGTVDLTQYKNVNETSNFTLGEIMTLISVCAKQQQGDSKDLIKEKLQTEELKNSFNTLLKGKFFLIGPLKDFFLSLIAKYNSENKDISDKKEYSFEEIDLESTEVEEEIRTAIKEHFKDEFTEQKGGKKTKSVQQTHNILLATQGDRMKYSRLALVHVPKVQVSKTD
jgi:hypothetical protein